MRVFLLQRLRERDGGLVATRSRASPPTVERLTVELEKGEPPNLLETKTPNVHLAVEKKTRS